MGPLYVHAVKGHIPRLKVIRGQVVRWAQNVKFTSFDKLKSDLGRKLQKFTQLKRNKRFDKFIMLVWVQGSPFHITARSHSVQETWGSQDSLYRGQIQKLLECCREPYHQIPLVIMIQKKFSLTYLRRTVP